MLNIKSIILFVIVVSVFAYCTVHTTNQPKQECTDQGGVFFENTDSASLCVITKE